MFVKISKKLKMKSLLPAPRSRTSFSLTWSIRSSKLGEEELAEHVELRKHGVGQGGHLQEADGAALGRRRVDGRSCLANCGNFWGGPESRNRACGWVKPCNISDPINEVEWMWEGGELYRLISVYDFLNSLHETARLDSYSRRNEPK